MGGEYAGQQDAAVQQRGAARVPGPPSAAQVIHQGERDVQEHRQQIRRKQVDEVNVDGAAECGVEKEAVEDDGVSGHSRQQYDQRNDGQWRPDDTGRVGELRLSEKIHGTGPVFAGKSVSGRFVAHDSWERRCLRKNEAQSHV